MARTPWTACAALLAGAACLTMSSTSRADAAEMLRPSDKALWYAGGIGPGLNFRGCGAGGCSSSYSYDQFLITNEIGYHLNKRGDGPAIGGILLLGFGPAFGETTVRFSPQFKFWWDIPIKKQYAIYLTPGASAGYGLFTVTGGNGVVNFFATQVTFAGRVVLKDKAILFFQPVTLDIEANPSGAAFGYNLIAGGGVTF